MGRKLSALELIGPLAGLVLFAQTCQNRPLRIWVDNAAGSVGVWRKGYSSFCALCTTIVKAISVVAAGLGCRVTVEKVTRCSNEGAVMADALSKGEFGRFPAVAAAAGWGLRTEPARVPGEILRWLADPKDDDELGGRILLEMSRTCAVLGYSC